MRIAMLSWETLHSIAVGGGAAHVSELAAAMAHQGHDVHVFTRIDQGQSDYQVIDGVHYYRTGYRRCRDFVDDVNHMCRAFVDRVFSVEDSTGKPFEVVHAHDWLAVNAMIWIKQGRKRHCLFTIHSTEYARCGNVFHNGQSHRIRDQERAGTYWADRIIAVSSATKQELAWMYEVPADKIAVVHNGVRRARFDGEVDPGGIKRRYNLGPVDPTILFCGRLDYQKGPDILVQAIPRVLRQHSQARFVFAGDGSMRNQLELGVKHAGCSDAVRFLGYRTGQELVELFKMADMVCVPSRNEPFGIVVLEAWAAGKPVVVTHNGGPGEYVEHEVNGLKIYDDPDSVVWGLDRLLRDFDLARRMGANGRRAVERAFSWEKVASETLALYRHTDPSHTAAPPDPGGATETHRLSPTHVAPPARNPCGQPVTVNLKLPTPISLATRDLVHTSLTQAGCRVIDQTATSVRIDGTWRQITAALRGLHENITRENADSPRITIELRHQARPAARKRASQRSAQATRAPAMSNTRV